MNLFIYLYIYWFIYIRNLCVLLRHIAAAALDGFSMEASFDLPYTVVMARYIESY